MQRELILTGYIIFFAFLHSLTASMPVKQMVYKYMDAGVYRLLYTVISVVTILPLLYLWLWDRSPSKLIYTLEFPYYIISMGMVIAGAALVLNSLILIDLPDFIGLKGVLKIKPKVKSSGLTTKGAYGITRHPLYLGGMLVLWANPWMHSVDLVVALLFTLYFIVGGWLEERKLEVEFGDEYREYKKKVSMFLPVKWVADRIKP